MSDLVERLRDPDGMITPYADDASYGLYLREGLLPAWRRAMTEAADEIEHLRSLAGAVSRGESAAQINAIIRAKYAPPTQPT